MKRWLRVLLWGLTLASVVGLHELPSFKNLEQKGLDGFQTRQTAYPDIVIVAIDSKSIAQLGRWPWSRTVHAQLLDALTTYQPQVVGYDVLFADPESESSDAALSQSLAKSPFPVVLAEEATFSQNSQPKNLIQPLERLRTQKTLLGQVNVPADTDGLVRSFPQPLTFGGTTQPPFTFQIASQVQALLPPPGSQKLVAYAGPAGTFTTVSASDVLQGKVPKELLSHKIILIGATASDLHDTLLTPNNPPIMAGVEWHANVLSNILLQNERELLPPLVPVGLGIGIFLLFLLLVSRVRARTVLYVLLGLVAALPVLSFLMWQLGFGLPFVGNTLFAASLFAANGLYRWYLAEAEKRKLKQTFQNYFSPQVLGAILKDPKLLSLGGQTRQVTILFSDIRGFTTITENLPPEDLTQILHEYFTEMAEEVLATDGVLDKFIGDAIMAFWGAPVDQPDQADRAVQAALGMERRLGVLQQKWKSLGYPEIKIGVGINTGQATVGNMGSQKRFDYTVIGDSVNAASRLEGLNKEYASTIIISESTKLALQQPVACKELGQVLVKGKQQKVTIFEVLGYSTNV